MNNLIEHFNAHQSLCINSQMQLKAMTEQSFKLLNSSVNKFYFGFLESRKENKDELFFSAVNKISKVRLIVKIDTYNKTVVANKSEVKEQVTLCETLTAAMELQSILFC